MSDPFKVLGVDRTTATLVELKKKWWELAREHHPDHGGSPEEFQKMQLAYLVARNMMQKDPCPTCKGTGKITATTGFFTMSSPCAACEGTGYKHFAGGTK